MMTEAVQEISGEATDNEMAIEMEVVDEVRDTTITPAWRRTKWTTGCR